MKIASLVFPLIFAGITGGFAQNTSPLDTAPGGAPSSNASAASAPATNLVSNSDFALATQDPTWPDDWGHGTGISWQIEGGKHFLRLVQQQPGALLMAYREIAIPAGTKNLQITFRYRTSGIVHGTQNWMDARAIFHFLDADRKPMPPDPHFIGFSTRASDWTDATEQCPVPEGATRLALMPALFKAQAGTLDLAQVTVTSLP
jgi:hypothetical protein